jgi:hypothetical protein
MILFKRGKHAADKDRNLSLDAASMLIVTELIVQHRDLDHPDVGSGFQEVVRDSIIVF